IVVKDIGNRIVSDAQHPRNEKTYYTENKCADCGMPQIVERQVVEQILYPVEKLRESDRRESANHAEKQIIRQAMNGVEKNMRIHGEHGMLSEQEPAHRSSQGRCNHQRNEGTGAKFEKEQFDGENHAGDWSVECGGHAGAGSAGEQYFAFGRGRRDELPDERTKRAAGLNDGAFRAEWAARADGDGRRERLQDGDFRFNPAAGGEHGFHGFRNAMTFDFVAAVLGHEADNQTSDNRDDDDPIMEGSVFRTAEMKRPRVIVSEIGD